MGDPTSGLFSWQMTTWSSSKAVRTSATVAVAGSVLGPVIMTCATAGGGGSGCGDTMAFRSCRTTCRRRDAVAPFGAD
ncbi:hypothetical protein DQ237_17160 [Blastococcus sp. TF02-8]|nr:hypothetical protein DQ237_17160 [Blastococcus sp. TF02-8]